MSIRILLIAVFIILLGAGIVLCYMGYTKRKKPMTIAGVIGSLVMLLGLICVPMSVYTVDTGEVAVVKFLGQANNVRYAGTYFDFWITNTFQKYDTKTQTIQINTATYSSDAQTMDIQMTVQYKIMPDHAIKIAEQYGSLEALQSRIESVAIEKAKATLSSYKAMNIIADRASMSPLVEEAIKKAIDEKFYVDIQTVAMTNIDFSDAFEKAVEDKMIAEQQQLKANYENETKIAKAKADAEAKLVQAEAEAKANDLLEKSLTDKILRQLYIEKWDGKLPSTVAGEAATMLIPAAQSADSNTPSQNTTP
ncbi:MAG: prohibitin family protein [Acutalibacteraceae bacterium]|nr:prohibitin family protein [Clostridia bacterium]MEE3403089.1 prohibitin family protein [Acutalibacteraceae bacterium]HCA55709.1 hypothetical protein [Oscillospiraceae bacterium]